MAYVADRVRARNRDRGRRARQAPRGRGSASKPLYPRESESNRVADESYPDDLSYHPEHDWARIEGDEATFGITWYAQDALGEVVFYDPPEVGDHGEQGPALRRGGVGQGRLRRVRAALGRDRRGQRGAGRRPRSINSDPYGDGWLVKVKLSDPSEVESLLDVAAYKELL